MSSRVRSSLSAIVLGLSIGVFNSAMAQELKFALIGDLGYFPREEPWLANVLDDLNRNSDLQFVVHVGDLSSPRYACTDELLNKRLAQFQASMHPFIYTPGDNEWTDCHDAQGVKDGNPLERLAKVRSMFFEGEQSLGKRKIALTRQSSDSAYSKYRENARWNMGGVTFATIHAVGSNNGFGRAPDGDAEFADRNKADLAWMHQAFEHAKMNNSRAIMLMTQANIFPDFPPFPGNTKKVEGFVDIRELLFKEASTFTKPVIFVHGDSHYSRIDNPFRPKREPGKPADPEIENFLRLETFGSPNHHWVQATIDPNEPNVFVFRPRIVAANIYKR
jgi:Calcineurin-like phosphoesterase